MATSSQGPAHAHHHAVQFYGSDESLFATVATFLAEGLIGGQPCVVIATGPHRAGIVHELCGRLIDCDRAIRDGELLLLDADATLDLFMVGDVPDPNLFEHNVGRLVEQSLNGRRRVVLRAYGEMVDVLWKEGRADAALKLELLWNKLAFKYDFSLLCGYAMGSFFKQTQLLEAVCEHHSHIVADARNVLNFPNRATRTT